MKNLAVRLRSHGVDAKLDQWEVGPADELPHFMERSVRENNYVLVICTPTYKEKSNNRIGGVGYEGNIMTAEALQNSSPRKFIPVLKLGSEETAIPSWLKGKYYVDLSSDEHFESNYEDLITTLFKAREVAPKLGAPPQYIGKKTSIGGTEVLYDDSIKIKGILVDEVTEPQNSGERGSGLYRIPFKLSRTPSDEWIKLFIDAWNSPPKFTQMHRPSIASVHENKIILDGTTIEEVEQYHKDTLKLVVDSANERLVGIRENQKLEEKRREAHRRNINELSKRIRFD